MKNLAARVGPPGYSKNMATAPTHKQRRPLPHPANDISHSAKLIWALVALFVLAFIFIYLAWAASRVY